MSEHRREIEYVAGPNTPDYYRYLVGTKTFPIDLALLGPIPAGMTGTLLGVPGCLRPGWTWEIGGGAKEGDPSSMFDISTPGIAELATFLWARLSDAERWIRWQDEHQPGRERPYDPANPTDPSRVLAMLDATRQAVLGLLAIFDAVADREVAAMDRDEAVERHASRVLRLLARPYAGHPDYKAAWRP